jgi:hypothetical protein
MTIKGPTKREAERMASIREAGCVVAWKLGLGWIPAEVHHLSVTGKHGGPRRGHRYTVALNTWSHRGMPFGGLDAGQCQSMLGPSYAREPRAFRELYPDQWLLEQTDELLGWEDGDG